MKTPQPIAAVLTADFVNSTHFPSGLVEQRMRELLDCLKKEVVWKLEPEVSRGDSFQGVIPDVKDALKAAVLARAFLKSMGEEWDLRMAIGIGKIERLSDRPGTSDGEAFRLSGQLADTIKAGRARIAIGLPVSSEPLDAWMLMLEAILEKWTPRQAEVMVMLLGGSSLKEVAEALNMSPSAVTQHAQAARWWAIQPALNTFGHLVKAFYSYD